MALRQKQVKSAKAAMLQVTWHIGAKFGMKFVAQRSSKVGFLAKLAAGQRVFNEDFPRSYRAISNGSRGSQA